jgi:hypothetical protein
MRRLAVVLERIRARLEREREAGADDGVRSDREREED